ncbi:MAG: hypothetical protein P4M09_16865 [Devosia sp.]|nr:hypothetical protein [Devosia sp.]
MAEHSIAFSRIGREPHKPLTYEWTPFYEVVPPKRARTLRDDLEAEIDRLIEMPNAFDGDPDLEDGNDAEPSETMGSIPMWDMTPIDGLLKRA